MNKRVKPIKEMLDEKIMNLQMALANESTPNAGNNQIEYLKISPSIEGENF
jgi:hypothetical protein